MHASWRAAAAALVLALSGCGGTVSPSAPPASPTTAASPSRAASPAPGSTSATAEGLQAACGSPLTFTEKTLATASDGAQLKAWTRGEGTTAVVLLHQTNNNASCGWMSKLAWLEGQKVRVVLVDICGYGRSTCSSMPWAEQTKAAVAWAKSLGSTRVVLLGSSLGGTMALKAGPGSGADALIDVSGPAEFREGNLAADAPKATIPTLLVYSPTDSADLATARAALPAIPAPKKLVETKTGHGFETLEAPDVKAAVEAWIAGTYA